MSFGFAPKLSFHVPAAAHTFHPLGRTATSPDQRTHAVGLHDQREARHCWFVKPTVTGALRGTPVTSGGRSDLDGDLVLLEEVN